MSFGLIKNDKKHLMKRNEYGKMKKIPKKNALMKRVETTYGEEIEEILRYLYVDREYTLASISRTLNISYVTVVRWLKLAGIRHRRIKLGD